MFFISKSLLGIALWSLIFLAACQKETTPVAKLVETEEILANAGKLHNEMITYYYNNR